MSSNNRYGRTGARRKNRYRMKKKSNTGMFVGIGIVCLAVVACITIVAYLANGGSVAAFAETNPPEQTGAGLPTNNPAATPKPSASAKANESTSPEPTEHMDITFRAEPEADDTVYDYVILNARIINPETGNDLQGYNIGIIGSSIAAVTRRPLSGEKTVDATGLVAAPGFIDIDSYDPNPLGVKYKLADGVTTNLMMHGGATYTANWYDYYSRYTPLINYGASNFITKIRQEIGYGAYSTITSQSDIDKLCALVETNIKNGALGVSMSPEYAPGVEGAEMQALCELAAKYDLAVYYHLRYSTTVEPNTSIKGIEEVIDLAKKTGVSTHILHVTSTGSTYCVDEAFAVIEHARADGVDLTCDIYPYDSWATYLASNRFASGWQERFNLTYSDLQIANSSETLTAESFQKYRAENRLVIANGSIPEDELRYALKKPYVFIASDTIIEPSLDDHPRGSGSFSRLIGRYARDEKVITLMEAIAKATLLPAQRLESGSDDMKKKGRIEVGADADIVLFNYNTIIDTATNENVASYSEGIEYVFVCGKLALDPNGIKGLEAGKPVKNKYASPAAEPETETISLVLGEDEKQLEVYFINGEPYISLEDAANVLGLEYINNEDGTLNFGQAVIKIGETGFTSYGQKSNLSHEPVIFRGGIYIRNSDIEYLQKDLFIK